MISVGIRETVASHPTPALCCDPTLMVRLLLFCLQTESRDTQSTQGHRWSAAFKKKTLCVHARVHICEYEQETRKREKRNEHTLHFTVNNRCASLRASVQRYMEVLSPKPSSCKTAQELQ